MLHHAGHRDADQGLAARDVGGDLAKVGEVGVVGLERAEDRGGLACGGELLLAVDDAHVDLAEVAEGEAALAVDLRVEADLAAGVEGHVEVVGPDEPGLAELLHALHELVEELGGGGVAQEHCGVV